MHEHWVELCMVLHKAGCLDPKKNNSLNFQNQEGTTIDKFLKRQVDVKMKLLQKKNSSCFIFLSVIYQRQKFSSNGSLFILMFVEMSTDSLFYGPPVFSMARNTS